MLISFFPFKPKWKPKMLNDIKTCTTRTSRYGRVGDYFEIFGARFTVLSMDRVTLDFVAKILYKEEGCDSPEEFIKEWESLHPRAGFVGSKKVWAHHFERVLKG